VAATQRPPPPLLPGDPGPPKETHVTTPATETFGHEPTCGISLFGLAETVCARCTERGVWYGDANELRPVHILWPCTSAIVLGLAPRPAA
ncbi:hypothetical protein, partial [Streptomyces sp. NPDC007346]|uniref:hypothetical protein n=1 Tax=Streptomyces sp. NPDC007346 TaxID=3154682 RepID=UPI003455FC89